MIRLNKALARAGLASRRQADAMIAAGRVTVNGTVVSELGAQVEPAQDVIRLDGELVPAPESSVVYAVHKPRYVMSTTTDPEGRATVVDVIGHHGRLFLAGRLDFESEGLLIATNDGELAHRLMHPRFGHEKEYRVKISGTPTDTAMRVWRDGIYLEDGRTAPARVRVESSSGGGTWLRFTLREGRNRQVRRMVEAMSHTVHRLVRVRIGPVTLGDLAPGNYRLLTSAERDALGGKVGSAANPANAANAANAGDAGDAEPGSGRRKPKYGKGWARPRERSKMRGRKPGPPKPRR